MRILFLADAVFVDLPGGSRVVARELGEGLTRRGHEVTFLVARHHPDAPVDENWLGMRVVRYSGAGQGAGFVRAGQAACAALIETSQFDIVHTHFAYAAVGPLRALPKSVPHVRTFHGPWDEEGWVEDFKPGGGPLNRLKALAKRKMRYEVEASNLRRSERVTTLSESFTRQVVDRFRVPESRVRIIPGGADIERFTPAADKRAVRRALGLPEQRRILFSVRRLAPRMGLDNLIRAMSAVAPRHPDALLIVGGKGPERERLEHLVLELGLTESVRLAGFIPDDRLAAYYQAADLFVLPTMALEGFGLVTTEALASGVPVIGTPVGATPEILSALDPRLVAGGTSPEALAERIMSFLDGGWADELTPQRLRQFVLDRYTWDRHVAGIEEVYREVAGSARQV